MLVCLAAFAGVVAGCGGDDDSTAAASITKPQFVKKAKAICDDGRNEALVASGGNPVQNGVLPAIESTTARLSGLGAPDGEEDQVEALIQALEDDAARVKQKKAKTLAEFEDEFKGSAALAREYGVPACAFA